MLTNPGGPGGSGLDFLPFLAPKLDALMEDMIVVTFDPRVWASRRPVKCISDADLDASFGYEPDPVSQAAFDGNVDIARRMARRMRRQVRRRPAPVLDRADRTRHGRDPGARSATRS